MKISKFSILLEVAQGLKMKQKVHKDEKRTGVDRSFVLPNFGQSDVQRVWFIKRYL